MFNKKLFVLLSALFCCISSNSFGKDSNALLSSVYDSLNVVVKNVEDSIQLQGTVYIPLKKAKCPFVVFISGSGIQDRDETVANHKPFRVLAKFLASKGIGSIRVDDRGFNPPFNYESISVESDCKDANSCVDFLLSTTKKESEYYKTIGKKIDKNKIGLVGHSSGGAYVFVLGSLRNDIDFVISLAGPSLPGDESLLSQQKYIAKAMGTPDKFIELSQNSNKEYFNLVKKYHGQQMKDSVKAFVRKYYGNIPQNDFDAHVKRLCNNWMISFLRFDPYEYIKNYKNKALVLIGDKDCQVIASLNAPVFEKVFNESNNMNASVIVVEGVNHLFQKCTSGMPAEYIKIDHTISSDVLEILDGWINKNVLFFK